MSSFSDKQYPAWFIIVVAATTLIIALYAVRPIRTFTPPTPGRYAGSIAVEGLEEVPFVVTFDGEAQTAQFIFFHQHVPPQSIDLKSVGSLLGTATKPLSVLLFGHQYELTGAEHGGDLKGRVTGERGVLLGRWYAHKSEELKTDDSTRMSSYLITWKQSQELLKLKDKEDAELQELKDEDIKLRETLRQQTSIQVEGGRKLARAKRTVDEKQLARKKIINELGVTRGRIVLVQKISPQGKFIALSRDSLKEEAAWFFDGAKR